MFTHIEKTGGAAFAISQSIGIATPFNNRQPFKIDTGTFAPEQFFLSSREPLYIWDDVSLIKENPKGTGCFIDWRQRRVVYPVANARQKSIRFCFLIVRHVNAGRRN